MDRAELQGTVIQKLLRLRKPQHLSYTSSTIKGKTRGSLTSRSPEAWACLLGAGAEEQPWTPRPLSPHLPTWREPSPQTQRFPPFHHPQHPFLSPWRRVLTGDGVGAKRSRAASPALLIPVTCMTGSGSGCLVLHRLRRIDRRCHGHCARALGPCSASVHPVPRAGTAAALPGSSFLLRLPGAVWVCLCHICQANPSGLFQDADRHPSTETSCFVQRAHDPFP